VTVEAYQSNKREYSVLANPSLLTAAASGSRLLFITSSGVTITRLSRASSSEVTSHLIEEPNQIKKLMQERAKEE